MSYKTLLDRSLLVCAGVGLCLSSISAEPALVVGTLSDDAYITPHNSNGGAADSAPLYAYDKSAGGVIFPFNAHYSVFHLRWNLVLPNELVGQSLTVTSASVTLWQQKTIDNWNPANGKFKLFAMGIQGGNGFTAETWNESVGYIGPTPQDPYMVELGTQAHAEDNVNATPWAFGIVPPTYTGGTITEAFPITFPLNVEVPEIQTKLKTDLQAGFSLWTAGSTFFTAMPGQPAAKYPRIVTKEGVSNPAYGTLQKAPALILEVEPVQSSVPDWNLY